jgi:hypothetical protein
MAAFSISVSGSENGILSFSSVNLVATMSLFVLIFAV